MPDLRHLVEPVHAGRRLFGHALDLARHARPLLRVGCEGALQGLQHDSKLLRIGAGRVRHGAGALELDSFVHEQRRVTAVVEQHVRPALGPGEGLLGAPPVLLERLAFPGEDGDASRLVRCPLRADGNRRRGVILRGEDVARGPADLRAERDQRLDQHGGLDRHVQRAGDLGAAQRLRGPVLAPRRHQARHLVLGQLDLLAAPLGQSEVGDLEVRGGRLTHCGLGHVESSLLSVPEALVTSSR